MAVNLTSISDLETRNGDDQFAGVVANCAGRNEEIFEQENSTVVSFPGTGMRSAANFRSPNSPQSPVSLPTRRHFIRMSWRCPFLFSTLEMAQGVLLGRWVEMTRT
jgi:hypothetical protein